MDYKYIEQLLDRYFQGETTLQEEQILKAFYAQESEEMPQALRDYAALFAVVNEQETLGDDFDERLLAMTEGAVKVKARTISLTERLRPLFGAAAMVAILLTLGNAINQSMKGDDPWVDADEYAATMQNGHNSVEVAYDQVQDSLTLAKDELPSVTVVDSLLSSNID